MSGCGIAARNASTSGSSDEYAVSSKPNEALSTNCHERNSAVSRPCSNGILLRTLVSSRGASSASTMAVPCRVSCRGSSLTEQCYHARCPVRDLWCSGWLLLFESPAPRGASDLEPLWLRILLHQPSWRQILTENDVIYNEMSAVSQFLSRLVMNSHLRLIRMRSSQSVAWPYGLGWGGRDLRRCPPRSSEGKTSKVLLTISWINTFRLSSPFFVQPARNRCRRWFFDKSQHVLARDGPGILRCLVLTLRHKLVLNGTINDRFHLG